VASSLVVDHEASKPISSSLGRAFDVLQDCMDTEDNTSWGTAVGAEEAVAGEAAAAAAVVVAAVAVAAVVVEAWNVVQDPLVRQDLPHAVKEEDQISAGWEQLDQVSNVWQVA
jgi:hypothetical protein